MTLAKKFVARNVVNTVTEATQAIRANMGKRKHALAITCKIGVYFHLKMRLHKTFMPLIYTLLAIFSVASITCSSVAINDFGKNKDNFDYTIATVLVLFLFTFVILVVSFVIALSNTEVNKPSITVAAIASVFLFGYVGIFIALITYLNKFITYEEGMVMDKFVSASWGFYFPLNVCAMFSLYSLLIAIMDNISDIALDIMLVVATNICPVLSIAWMCTMIRYGVVYSLNVLKICGGIFLVIFVALFVGSVFFTVKEIT